MIAILGHSSFIDAALADEDLYAWSTARRQEFQLLVLRQSFRHHFFACEPYRRYCEALGATPDRIDADPSVWSIPLIPTSLFKELQIVSCPPAEVSKWCTSSGTQGIVSQVPRDDTTLERFFGSIRASTQQLFQVGHEATVFNLGPTTEEAGPVWFPYVMSLLDLIYPSTHYLRGNVFQVGRLACDLAANPASVQPLIIGPPSLLVRFLDYVEQAGTLLELGAKNPYVVTAGGWKRSTNSQIDRDELTLRCQRHLGIEHRSRVRDAYNMVELNTVLFECEEHAKHIPPWLAVSAVDAGTLQPLPAAQKGLLAFLDPSPTSYPGFVLSDDVGRILDTPCPCGRNGAILEFDRRVILAEERGCARTMEQGIKEEHEVLLDGDGDAR